MAVPHERHGAVPRDEAGAEQLELIAFSRQMAIVLRAGMPALDGIRLVRKQAVSEAFRSSLDDVETRLVAGMPLWSALGGQPTVFPGQYVELIHAAEDGGELDATFDRLASDLETGHATSASPPGADDRDEDTGVLPAKGKQATDPAPTPSAVEAPAPRTAQAAYDELVAKLRGGPVVQVAPEPPRRRWPWQRRRGGSSQRTSPERPHAKQSSRTGSDPPKRAKEVSKHVRGGGDGRKPGRAARAEDRRSARAAREEAKAARHAAQVAAKAEDHARRAAATAEKRARRAAASGRRFGRLRRLTGESRPVRKDVAGGGSWMERNFSSLSKVKRIDLIIFSRQMATFIRAGIPITDGIRVVREQTRSSLFRRTLDEVTALLESGEPLSGALAQHPRVFSELYIDMVVAAEATGELDAILDQLAKYLERSEATARQLRQAMLYPSIVLGLACVVVFILVTLVLPSFVALFKDFDAELPLPTQILLAVGEFGGTYGVVSGAGFLMLLMVVFLVRNSGPVRRLRQRIALRLPVVGTLIKLGIETRFARTLSILHKAGVPIAQSFEIAATGTANHLYQRRLDPVREALIAGEGISAPLAASRLFGPLLVQMIKVGEETGTLDRYLDEAANFLDEELAYRTKQMVTIIEPLMILGVAGVVGFVALSVITPMYSILQQIK